MLRCACFRGGEVVGDGPRGASCEPGVRSRSPPEQPSPPPSPHPLLRLPRETARLSHLVSQKLLDVAGQSAEEPDWTSATVNLAALSPRPGAGTSRPRPGASLERAGSLDRSGSALYWTPSRFLLDREIRSAQAEDAGSGPGGAAGGCASELAAERALVRRLARLGLDMDVMAGDGNCLFRAVASNLLGSQERHAQVRTRCVEHVKRHPSDFAPFLGDDLGEYLHGMARAGTWGDELMLRAACETYHVVISVITSQPAHWYLRYVPRDARRIAHEEEIFLTYIAPIHYNAIRRRRSSFSRVLQRPSSASFQGARLQPAHSVTLSANLSLAARSPEVAGGGRGVKEGRPPLASPRDCGLETSSRPQEFYSAVEEPSLLPGTALSGAESSSWVNFDTAPSSGSTLVSPWHNGSQGQHLLD